MYFGKTLCGFHIYPNIGVMVFIYVESGIIVGFDLFVLVEIGL